MEKQMFKLWAKAQCAKQAAKDKLGAAYRTFCEEDGDGGAGIIVAIILIIIVVALAIIFRDWIAGFVNKLFGQVDSDAEFNSMNVPNAQ